jgi:hypothetical protein
MPPATAACMRESPFPRSDDPHPDTLSSCANGTNSKQSGDCPAVLTRNAARASIHHHGTEKDRYLLFTATAPAGFLAIRNYRCLAPVPRRGGRDAHEVGACDKKVTALAMLTISVVACSWR